MMMSDTRSINVFEPINTPTFLIPKKKKKDSNPTAKATLDVTEYAKVWLGPVNNQIVNKRRKTSKGV